MIWKKHTETVIVGPTWVWKLDSDCLYNISARISMNERDTFDVVVELFRKHEFVDRVNANDVSSLFDARIKRNEIVNELKTRAIDMD